MDSSQFSDIAALTAVSGFLLVAVTAWLVPTIFFLLTLQKALNRVEPSRRTMNPPMVWLSLIPLFNLIWNFLVVNALAASLEAELTSRNIPHESNPGKTIGLAWAITSVVCLIPLLGLLAGLAGLVLWIVYWVKIAGVSKQLA